jgi:hypothetical protein
MLSKTKGVSLKVGDKVIAEIKDHIGIEKINMVSLRV